MDIQRIISLVRKWAWLVVLGGLLGVVGGYVYSQYQPEVYQTTTNILVSRAPEDREMDYISITSDMQLAKTYTRLIMTESVLKDVGEHLGFQVTKDQISVKQAPDMLILDITVKMAILNEPNRCPC
jgi:capsular polysaccharide biosynthesis protein